MKCSVSVCPPSAVLATWWSASSSCVPVATHPWVGHTHRKAHQAVLAPSGRIGTPLPVCLLRSKVIWKVPLNTCPGVAGAALGAGAAGLEASEGLAGGAPARLHATGR